ncbi:hypothetical protein [Marinobacterium weihaiense]|uniref:Uncharacterized protein n=1 Tax=Marinobacterium weihaiense TaxID=2851016 RepID=A0ABS6MD53_9GAMM|nr:hypothetical protein [Marinobacterium weihaiense]MBV0933662.1 hypothetical protein [Marinobacterium weihaiense]
MFKNISKTIARTALVASFGMLSMTAAQAAEAAPEVGHISWNWWQAAAAPHDSGSTPVTLAAHNAEIGHIGWSWWGHNGQPSDNAQADVHLSELTPENGHVDWQWWNDKTAG